MPIYDYKCRRCGKDDMTVRHHTKSTLPPGEDDGETPEPCGEELKHDWERIITPANLAYSKSWGPGKGHW